MKSRRINWRFATFPMLCVSLLIQIGCEGDGDDSSSSNWTHDFWEVSNGQAVSDAAPYSKGNSTAMLVFNTFDSSPNSWLREEQNLIPVDARPTEKSTVQLVAFIVKHEQNMGAIYNNGGYFYHYTCNVEIREALTARVVASKSFAGDNKPPPVIWGNIGTDWESIEGPLAGWLTSYIK